MTEKIKLICNYEDPMDLIETDPYRNNQKQAPIWLIVDWGKREADVITSYDDGTYSMRNHLNLEGWFRLPNDVDIIKLQDEWEDSELQNILTKMATTWVEYYDGSNFRGKFGCGIMDIEDPEDEIYNLPRLENAGIWDFGEWYCNGSDDYPDNYLNMEPEDVIDEMILQAKIENNIIFTESREQLIKQLKDDLEEMYHEQEEMEHAWRI